MRDEKGGVIFLKSLGEGTHSDNQTRARPVLRAGLSRGDALIASFHTAPIERSENTNGVAPCTITSGTERESGSGRNGSREIDGARTTIPLGGRAVVAGRGM